MDNEAIAERITRVIWRVSRDDLVRVLDSMGDDAARETWEQFRGGMDFFKTTAGRRFYKNGKIRK